MIHLAHRGLKTNASENSIAAFKAALKAGYDGVELDVRCLRSGELVVFHDENLQRLTGREDSIYDLSFTALQDLKLPDGSTIPTLDQVLKVLKGAVVNIELKDEASAKPVAKLLRGSGKQQIIVSSKEVSALEAFREANKKTPLGYISSRRLFPPILLTRKLKLTHYMGHQLTINWIGLTIARVFRLKIFCWPVKRRFMAIIMRISMIDGLIEDSESPLK